MLCPAFQFISPTLMVFAAPIEDEAGQYLTLSQYKDKFSAGEAPALK